MSFAFRQEENDDGKLRDHDKMRVCLKIVSLLFRLLVLILMH